MANIKKSLDTTDKLKILSEDSQYDLACACSVTDEDRRHRSKDDKWVYPVALPNRQGKTFLFKTLLSNVCSNDCKYCPLRANQDPRRCTLEPEELAKIFMDYYRAGKVQGFFLSSGVIGAPDKTMERINKTAAILRFRENFQGYMHLKIIPGASDAAIEEAVSMAHNVSLNIEAPGEKSFRKLCSQKNYLADVIRPIKLISELTAKGTRYSKVKQTTQFVVGASDETDQEIVKYSWGLYKRLNMGRVYFSAYQRGLGATDLPGEQARQSNAELLMREHRLYQVDWLIRQYGFQEDDIGFERSGNLSLIDDPKAIWARTHPEFFPLNANKASRYELLRVPGLGPVTVGKILTQRRQHRLRGIADIGKPGKLLRKAETYLHFS
jgi:predicted DNA-binding helix-hairpin-helix protein